MRISDSAVVLYIQKTCFEIHISVDQSVVQCFKMSSFLAQCYVIWETVRWTFNAPSSFLEWGIESGNNMYMNVKFKNMIREGLYP